MSRGCLVALSFASLVSGVALGCGKQGPQATKGTSSGSDAKSKVELPKGPCAVDADCAVYLDACDCSCPAAAVKPSASLLPGWNECVGGPPRNCGVASPCMSLEPACEPATTTCIGRTRTK